MDTSPTRYAANDVHHGDRHDALFQRDRSARRRRDTTKRPTTRPRHCADISASGPGMPISRAGQRMPDERDVTVGLDLRERRIRQRAVESTVRATTAARVKGSFVCSIIAATGTESAAKTATPWIIST